MNVVRGMGLTACVALLTVFPVRGDDLASGPEKGARVPALTVHDCTGENKDKSVDLAALTKDKTAVIALVAADKFDRPMNRFLKTLDTKVAADLESVTLAAVWLTDDEEKTKSFLPRVQTSVQYEKTALAVFNGKDGPKGWNVNSDAHLTVVLVHKGKVAGRFAYRSVNDADVPAVLRELKKLAKK